MPAAAHASHHRPARARPPFTLRRYLIVSAPSPRLAGPAPEPVVLVLGLRRGGVDAVPPAPQEVEERADPRQAEDPHERPRSPRRLRDKGDRAEVAHPPGEAPPFGRPFLEAAE